MKLTNCYECKPQLTQGVLIHDSDCPQAEIIPSDSWDTYQCEWCGSPFIEQCKEHHYCSSDCKEAWLTS